MRGALFFLFYRSSGYTSISYVTVSPFFFFGSAVVIRSERRMEDHDHEVKNRKSVCVIGCGPAGLVAIKVCSIKMCVNSV